MGISQMHVSRLIRKSITLHARARPVRGSKRSRGSLCASSVHRRPRLRDRRGMHARADRRLNRVRVLQAAATLAATRGLSFSMSDVAELAQVSRSTVHRAFAGKAELLDAVAIDGWERTLATVRNHRVRAERSVAPVTLRHFERAVLDVAEDFVRADAFIVGAEQIAGRKPVDVIPLVGLVEHELSRLYDVVVDEAGPPRPGAIGDVLAIVTSYRAPERVTSASRCWSTPSLRGVDALTQGELRQIRRICRTA